MTTERRPFNGLDLDTFERGTEPPFDPWEDDHTGLVHVLWSAQSDGLIARDADCARLATMIMRSRWLAATRFRAKSEVLEQP